MLMATEGRRGSGGEPSRAREDRGKQGEAAVVGAMDQLLPVRRAEQSGADFV